MITEQKIFRRSK